MEQLGRHGARLKDLRRRVRSRRDGEVVVDGLRLVQDLVRWGVPLRELYVAEGLVERPEIAQIAQIAETAWTVADQVLADLAPTRHPQGVLAVVDEPDPVPWSGRDGTAVWLEEVQDPGNVGAVVRSAAGLGAAAVLLSPGCADPLSPLAVRGGAAAQLRVTVERDVLLADAVDRVHRGGGSAWATAEGGVPVRRWTPMRPLLLLLGSEGRGLGAAAVAAASGIVTVSMERQVESRNVAVAAGILLHAARVSSRADGPAADEPTPSG